MTMQSFLIFDEAARIAAESLNSEAPFAIQPRPLDGPSAPAELAEHYAAPASLLDHPDYARWHPSLSLLPIRSLDVEMVFAGVAD